MRGFALIAALGCWTTAARLDAQALRRFTTFRQLHHEQALTARIRLTEGSLRIVPSRSGELYRAEVGYDPVTFVPITKFDSVTNALLLRVAFKENEREETDNGSVTFRINNETRPDVRQSATIAFSPQVNTALKLMLFDADADLELGGLRIASFDMTTGAGTTAIRFSQPNGISCQLVSVRGGLGEVSLLGLANSRCKKMSFQGGVGEAVLDFGGAWSSDATVDARMTVGQLTLRLPRRIGVRIKSKTTLAEFEPHGLVREGNAFVSPNYATATWHLDVNLSTILGSVSIEWIED